MTVDGLLAEHVALPAARVVVIPPTVGEDAATVLEPVAIGFRIRAEIAARQISPGSALLIGAGPLGILIGQLLAADGWLVTIEEPSAARRTRASQLGLAVVAPGEATGWRATLVVDTSAVEAGTRAALAAACPGALVVLLGRSPADVPAADVLMREIDLLGVRGGAGHYEDAVLAVADGVLDPAALIDDVHKIGGISDLESAFRSHERPTPPLRSVLHLQ
jgi:L-iditol 2-dehydrogenase/L-gulonate 5-dehydrogenase